MDDVEINEDTCPDTAFIIQMTILSIMQAYIIVVLIYLIFADKDIHDSVSSAIYDAKCWYKRGVSVILGFISAALLWMILDEYKSRYSIYGDQYIYLYVMEIAGMLFIGLMGMFPGGRQYEEDANYHRPYVSLAHTGAAFSAFLLINATSIYYAWNKRDTRYGGLLLTANTISIASACVFLILTSGLLYDRTYSGQNRESTPLTERQVEEGDTDGPRERSRMRTKRRERLAYCCEIVSLLLCIVIATISTIFRNHHIPCISIHGL